MLLTPKILGEIANTRLNSFLPTVTY